MTPRPVVVLVTTPTRDEGERIARELVAEHLAGFPGGHSTLEPPDPISNSEVKRCSADGSTRFPSCESRSSPGF